MMNMWCGKHEEVQTLALLTRITIDKHMCKMGIIITLILHVSQRFFFNCSKLHNKKFIILVMLMSAVHWC